jgi:hypothetical protein
MNTFTFSALVTFSLDKGFTMDFDRDVLTYMKEKGFLSEGKTRGSVGIDWEANAVCFCPYATADTAKKLVKEKIEIGVFTKAEKMKKQLRIFTTLPYNLTNEQAQRLYEEDARLVSEELGKGLYKPLPTDLSALHAEADEQETKMSA